MRNKTTKYSVFVLLFCSCRIISPDHKYEPIVLGQFYFPTYHHSSHSLVRSDTANFARPIIIEPNDSLSEFQNKWYSKHLNSLGEPILYNQRDKKMQVVRFTHLGTWTHPRTYRLEKRDSAVFAFYSVSNGQGGYKAGIRKIHESRKLDLEVYGAIVNRIDSIRFWEMGTHDTNGILDGAEWILEVLNDDQYHLVTRNCPDVYDDPEYAQLCTLIQESFDR